jgi:hypothetical protein
MRKILAFVLIFVCISTASAALQIQNLNVEDDGGIRITASFYEDYNPIVVPGMAKVRIVNDEGIAVYAGEFSFSEDDYKTLTLPYSDMTYQGVEHLIPETAIEKSKASSSGTLYFDLYQGAALIDSEERGLYSLPKLSEKELEAASEQEYLASAIPLDFSGRAGDLEIKLVRYGLYRDYSYQVTELLRVDFEIENKAVTKESLYLYGSSVLDDKGVQHEYSYSTPTSTIDIFPGDKKTGFLLFSDYSDAGLSQIYLGNDIIADIQSGTLSTMAEKRLADFHQSSTKPNSILRIDKFVEVTLSEYGYMFLGAEEYFACSIAVKNLGTESLQYDPAAVVLTSADQTVKSEMIYEGTFKDVFESGEIVPGASRSGVLFFKRAEAKELLINSGYTVVQGQKEMGDAEQVTYNNFYVFKFPLDGRQKKSGSGTIKIEWDILGVIGLGITIVSIVAGWYISKMHRKETVKFIDEIDDIYHKYNTQQGICIEQLNAVRKELKDEFDKGKIDIENLNLLMARIDKHMDELKK